MVTSEDLMNKAGLHQWEQAEQGVQEKLSTDLAAHLALATEYESLAFDLLQSIEQLGVSADVYRAQATLLARVLQDLRCITSIAPLGYTMQAWTIASSAFEASYALGFIGSNQDRARRWLEHKDMKNLPWPTYDAVSNSLRYLDIGEDASSQHDLAQNEYKLYTYLCMAKHVNPLPERNRYWFTRSGSTRLLLTPVYTPARAAEARLGLSLALRSTTNAIWIFRKTHVDAAPDLDQRLLDLASRSANLFREWKRDSHVEGADA